MFQIPDYILSNFCIIESVEADEESEHFVDDEKSHACNIKLHRSDYFTIPTLDDLDEKVDDEGRCIVKNFTIGRRNYGNVVFYDAFDVAGLDLDSIGWLLERVVIKLKKLV